MVISELLQVGMVSAELRRRQAEWTTVHDGLSGLHEPTQRVRRDFGSSPGFTGS